MSRARGKLRCGHQHPKAKLTDQEVDALRNLADEGWSYGKLAAAFEISKGGVAKIVKCLRRAVVPILSD